MTAEIIDIKDNEEAALARALAALADGQPIGLPTETVYGLAGDVSNPAALNRIYAAKGRPRFNPLIAHVASLEMARQHAVFSPLAAGLAASFWPGPLTLVLPLADGHGIHELATAGLDTVAVRMPRGFASRVIAAFGKPLAVPSANRSGRITATSAAHVAEDLGADIPLILDGGPTPVGVESTILKVDGDALTLLRPGGIATEAIEAVACFPVARLASSPQGVDGSVIAPGMLSSHYAPAAQLVLEADACQPGDAVIRFGGRALGGEADARLVLDLSPAGDINEAATNLFGHLKAADASGAATIRVGPVPHEGLGEAIADRLQRAAAPRP
ncbi:L-threonylcarbamoyladenylate synthase [Pseudohoeflea coraliihabitans]|uniref:Threonylcarbamoyl-AMP synthase n=1 Tax=Pseudohoeflea coraliihabitans TaxID=2860393 RepID=A0ABS6WPG0_9HYPH|nr:L-threonylcarbamoyladenylate synthase [Pseudohoeflea sp. DP4N28-3]MBW3096959.1 threonylcarbamoyl-AMP synthase [Pseudohoeflea sp. DP4N28-3]